jgi:Flp pilus assembly pilin Flp
VSISEHTLIVILIVVAIVAGLVFIWKNLPRRRG